MFSEDFVRSSNVKYFWEVRGVVTVNSTVTQENLNITQKSNPIKHVTSRRLEKENMIYPVVSAGGTPYTASTQALTNVSLARFLGQVSQDRAYRLYGI